MIHNLGQHVLNSGVFMERTPRELLDTNQPNYQPIPPSGYHCQPLPEMVLLQRKQMLIHTILLLVYCLH